MEPTSQSPITRIRPLGDRVLVRQEAWRDKLGSIYIPQGSREGFEERGVVVAVGSKYPEDLRAGDTVIFRRQPASALLPDVREGDPRDWKDLLMLKPDSILAVIED